MATILQVSFECPFPPRDGGRADILSRTLGMAELGHEVHLLVMEPTVPINPAHLEHLRDKIASVTVVPRIPLWRSIATFEPTLAARNRTLTGCAIPEGIDLVLAESEHVTAIFDNPGLRKARKVLRLHNDEAAYMRSLAKAEPKLPKRIFFLAEAMRFGRHSRLSFAKTDFIWAISQTEAASLARSPELAPKIRWLPPVLATKPVQRDLVPDSAKVLFAGNLTSGINQEALAWYLDHIHPRLLKISGYWLNVAGSVVSRGLRRPPATAIFERLARTDRCTLHADLPSLDSVYAENQLFVNPMQRGAGLKVKTVHAAAQAIPILSTTIGNEGTGMRDGEHVIVADSPEAFARAAVELLHHPAKAQAMADRAFEFIVENYSDKMLEHLLQEGLHLS